MRRIRLRFRKPRTPGYEIRVMAGILGRAGVELKRRFPGVSPFVLSSPRVWRLWGGALEASLRRAGLAALGRHLIPDGERHKDFDNYERALRALARSAGGRRVVALLLGGGAVGDLGGLAAATYRRGVPFVQIPTTLLAMVDSSVGGKLGVDFDTPKGRIKNLVGVFAQPELVLADPRVLDTLAARQYRSGLAEAVKTAALFDPPLFAAMERDAERLLRRDPKLLELVIARCVAHKARVVMRDEFDRQGARALLNLGHTFGHAVEAASDFRVLHGEAVAFGMACAVDLSRALGLARPELFRLPALLARLGLPVRLRKLRLKKVLAALSEDKKFEGAMRLVVPRALGRSELRVVENRDVLARILRDRIAGS